MKINIGVSNRHVHLTKEDYNLLFGDEYKIIKNLSQPSDFVTDKVVTLKTSKYEIKNVIYDEISTIEFYSSNDVIKELNNNFYGMILQSEIKKVERLREYKDE